MVYLVNRAYHRTLVLGKTQPKWGVLIREGGGRKVNPNLRLVKYFMNEFYANKIWNLEHIASPTFVFDLNNGNPMDFAEYAASMKFTYSVATIDFGDLKALNDEIFVADWVMSLKTDRAEMENGTGLTEFTVERGLLKKVAVYFDVNEYVFQYFGGLRPASLDQKSDKLASYF